MDPEQELRTLKRGLRALSIVNKVGAVGITALARELNIPRTSAERILVTLASEGYVRRLPNDKRYMLSSKVCTLSSGFSDECRIVQVATPLLFAMTTHIGWPLAITTRQDDAMILRVTSDPATSWWLHRRRIGLARPMLASSSGLLAFAMAEPAEQAVMRAQLMTSRHAVNRERARSQMMLDNFVGSIATKRYAIQPPPNDMPERSVSVPIMLGDRVVAVLTMMYMPRALSNAVVVRDYLPMLQALAAEVVRRVESDDYLDDDGGEESELPAALRAVALSLRMPRPTFAN